MEQKHAYENFLKNLDVYTKIEKVVDTIAGSKVPIIVFGMLRECEKDKTLTGKY